MNGVPPVVVSRRLGHSKPSITLDIFGHFLPGMQAQATEIMDDLVTPIAARARAIVGEDIILIRNNRPGVVP